MTDALRRRVTDLAIDQPITLSADGITLIAHSSIRLLAEDLSFPVASGGRRTEGSPPPSWPGAQRLFVWCLVSWSTEIMWRLRRRSP